MAIEMVIEIKSQMNDKTESFNNCKPETRPVSYKAYAHWDSPTTPVGRCLVRLQPACN